MKTILMLLLGILSATLTAYSSTTHPPNAFILFLLIDISFNVFYFNDKIELDR